MIFKSPIFTICEIAKVSAKILILLSKDMSLSSLSNCFSRLFRLWASGDAMQK